MEKKRNVIQILDFIFSVKAQLMKDMLMLYNFKFS